jgi:integrase
MTELVRLRTRPSRDGSSFTYLIDYIDENGKRRRISLGHADRKKAERHRAQKERELRMDIVTPMRMKLSELLRDYLERTRTQIEPSTAASAAYRMKDFIAANGNIFADTVTFEHCEKFQQFCIDRGLCQASANTHVKMVRRIFSLAVKRGQLEKNPFNGISLMKVPKKTVRLINENEFGRLMNAAQKLVWKARILIAKTSGLRRGEVLNLTVNDVDFAKSKIIVQPKPDTDYTWRWVVKDKERRELPLVEEVAKLLTAIQLELPEKQPYFFLSPNRYKYIMKLKDTGKLIDRIAKCPEANFRRDWKLICNRAGVEGVTFHDLRATSITEWFEQGMMPHEVQRLAGHSSIETTMNYYVGIRESMIDRARQASSAALGTDFGTHLARAPQNAMNVEEDGIAAAMQTLIKAGVINIGARGLEPPTS